jgi:predicted alpha/beta hydrolase family esterase
VTVFSGSVTVDKSKLPIVGFYDSRDLASSVPRRIVVEVIGGPGMDISPGLNDYLPLLLVERGVFVVRIGYTGTRHGSSFPDPDLDNAASQVRSYANKIRHLHPQGKVVLLGDSLGGMISAKAAGDLPSAALDGLALVLPLVFSGDEATQNFKDMFSARNEHPHASNPIRLIRSPHDPWSAGRVVTVPSVDLFSGFFPDAGRHRSLETYLAETKGLKKILAFGENDDRTGNAGVASIRRNVSDVEVIKLERNGHILERRVAQQIADSMYDLLLR